MKRICIIVTLMVVFGSCSKEYPEPKNKNMLGDNNAFLLESGYVSHNGNELFMDLYVGAVGGGMANDITFNSDSAFRYMPFPISSVEVQSVERITLNESRSYSNMLLIDLSEGSWGTWNDFDIFNLRNRAYNRILREGHADPANKIAIASYAEENDGSLPYTVWTWTEGKNAYDQTYEEHAKIIDYLYTEEGGSNSIYDALDMMIDVCRAYTPPGNRNITVMNHSEPLNPNNFNLNSLAQRAIDAGIKINLISISDDYNRSLLTLVLKTGGFTDMVSSTTQYTLNKGGLMDKGTTMISSIHKVLQRNLRVYKVRCRVVKNSGTWISGMEVYNLFEVNDYYSDGSLRLSNIIPVYAKIP